MSFSQSDKESEFQLNLSDNDNSDLSDIGDDYECVELNNGDDKNSEINFTFNKNRLESNRSSSFLISNNNNDNSVVVDDIINNNNNNDQFDDEKNDEIFSKEVLSNVSCTWNCNPDLTFVKPVNNSDTPHDDTDPNETFFFRSVVEPIFSDKMVQSPETFGDFDISNSKGTFGLTSSTFHAKAFTNSGLGVIQDNPQEGVGIGSHCRSFIANNGLRMDKVSCYVEVLVKQIYKNTSSNQFNNNNNSNNSNDESSFFSTMNLFAMDDDKKLLSYSKLFHPENIVGHRFWYFFHDKSIHPVDAIDREMKKNAKLRGLLNTSIAPPMIGQRAIELANEFFPGENSLARYRKFVQPKIKKVINSNSAMGKNKKNWENKKVSTVSDYSKEIYNRVTYFNNITCHYDNDLKKLQQSDNIVNSLNEEPNPFHKDVLEFIDPRKFLSLWNPNIIKQSREQGVSGIQIDHKNYFTESFNSSQKFRFPVPELIFKFNSSQIEKIETIKLPWLISLFDVELNKHINSIKDNSNLKHERVSQKIFSTTNKRALDTICKISKAQNSEIKKIAPKLKKNEKIELFEEKHVQFSSKSILPTANDLTNNNDECIHIKDKLTEFQEVQLEKLDKLKKHSPTMNEEQEQELWNFLIEDGLRLLDSAFNQANNVTDTVKSAIKILRKIESSKSTAFHEFVTSLPHMGLGCSYNAKRLMDLEINKGFVAHHADFLTLITSLYRAAHCPITDKMNGISSEILHVILNGVRGCGKSWQIDKLKEIKLKDSITNITSQSARADNIPKSKDDSMIIIDEPGILATPHKATSPGDVSLVNNLKNGMTGFLLEHKYLTVEKDENGNVIPDKRKQRTVLSSVHRAVVMVANNILINKKETSFFSRFSINQFILSKNTRVGKKITTQSLPTFSSNRDRILKQSSTWIHEWDKLEHALHVLAAKAIKLLVLPYPNIKTLSIHFSQLLPILTHWVPSISGDAREIARLTTIGVTECINQAINTVFTSEASPFIKFNRRRNCIETTAFRLKHIKAIAPFLFLREDSAIHIITRHVTKFLIRSTDYELATILANQFCNYYTIKQLESMTQDQKKQREKDVSYYLRVRKGDSCFYDVNYVRAKIQYEAIIEWLCLNGYNNSTAKGIIDNLLSMQIRVDYIDLKKDPTEEDVVFEKVISAARLISDEDTLIGTCKRYLYISTAYLEYWSEDQVLKKVMDTICYSGIRERDVLLGVTIEGYPFLWKKYHVKPATGDKAHDLEVKNTSFVPKIIKDSLFNSKTLTKEARSHVKKMSSSSSNSHIIYSQDAEAILCDEFLKKDVGIKDANRRKFYHPESLDKYILLMHKTIPIYKNRKKINYPDDIIKSYKNQYTNDQNYSKNSATHKIWSSKPYTPVITGDQYQLEKNISDALLLTNNNNNNNNNNNSSKILLIQNNNNSNNNNNKNTNNNNNNRGKKRNIEMNHIQISNISQQPKKQKIIDDSSTCSTKFSSSSSSSTNKVFNPFNFESVTN